jgi:hypothetical protein
MVFTSPTDEGLRSPPSAVAYKEQMDYWRTAVEAGAVEAALHGQGRAIFLVNAKSEADLDTFLQAVPLADQMNRTVEPLEDFFDHATRIHAYLQENDANGGLRP